MNELVGLVAALAGGAAGNAAGKSKKVGGDKKLNKLLGPAGAVLAAILFKQATGSDLSTEEIVSAGVLIGTTGVGVYSGVKNLYQGIKSLLGKD